jgi:hypothetical protein
MSSLNYILQSVFYFAFWSQLFLFRAGAGLVSYVQVQYIHLTREKYAYSGKIMERKQRLIPINSLAQSLKGPKYAKVSLEGLTKGFTRSSSNKQVNTAATELYYTAVKQDHHAIVIVGGM